jgi:excisionase family DNA binding protein
MLSKDEPPALRIAEVARRLQVDPRTVRGMIRRGELHGVKTGRVWRVPVESLDRLLQSGGDVNRSAIAVGGPKLAESKEVALSDEELARRIRAIQGKYRDVLSSVDEFIVRKQEEIAWENRRWPSDDP